MPSFEFFGSSSPVEQVTNPLSLTVNESAVSAIHRETSLGKFFIPLDSSVCLGGEDSESDRRLAETRRVVGTTGSRAMSIHNKRNRTIGLGEFEQLDLMVIESVIRWASCTNVSNASLSDLLSFVEEWVPVKEQVAEEKTWSLKRRSM